MHMNLWLLCAGKPTAVVSRNKYTRCLPQQLPFQPTSFSDNDIEHREEYDYYHELPRILYMGVLQWELVQREPEIQTLLICMGIRKTGVSDICYAAS